MSQNAKCFVDATFRFTRVCGHDRGFFGLGRAESSFNHACMCSFTISSDLHKESRIGDIRSLVINVNPWHTLRNLYAVPVFLNEVTDTELHEGLCVNKARSSILSYLYPTPKSIVATTQIFDGQWLRELTR